MFIYVDQLDPKLSAWKCEVIDLGGGEFSLRTHTGAILTVTPDGEWRLDPESSIGQPWQRFRRGAKGLIAEREVSGVWTYYLRPFDEVV